MELEGRIAGRVITYFHVDLPMIREQLAACFCTYAESEGEASPAERSIENVRHAFKIARPLLPSTRNGEGNIPETRRTSRAKMVDW